MSRNHLKIDWLSALHITKNFVSTNSEQIRQSGIRWQCILRTKDSEEWAGEGVSKRKARQVAAQKACAQIGLDPVMHGQSYRFPVKSR